MPLTITDATTEFVTLDEVKRHANITSAAHDVELEMIKGAAQDAVEGLIGPVLWRTVSATARASGGGAVLNVMPIVSLTSATVGGASVAATLDAAAGMLTGLGYVDGVSVEYVAGRTSCPDAVRLATLIIAAHLWRTQQGNSPSALPVDDELPSETFGVGYSIPRRAEDLLAPYLLLPGVA